MTRPNGYTMWQGRSMLDGARIMAVATGLSRPSENRKTGAMIQVWIMRSDMAPHTAQKYGADASICGACPLRSNGCYVTTVHAPLAVFREYELGRYPSLSPAGVGHLSSKRGLPLRIGAYGDPAAVPMDVWSRATQAAQEWTGYTHFWRDYPGLRRWCIASVESERDAKEAQALGWRTFRIRSQGATVLFGEQECLYSKAGVPCSACKLCNGAGLASSITIEGHGPLRKK